MKNPDVDAYIARSAPFARPILHKIRGLFHQARPEIEEKIKWGCPSFERGGIIGIMAAFRAHCRLVPWKDVAEKITSVSQLPKDAVARIRAGVAAQASGRKQKPDGKSKPPLKVPPISWPRSGRTGRPGPPSRPSRRATGASTWSGSSRRRPRRRASGGGRRPCLDRRREIPELEVSLAGFRAAFQRSGPNFK
jgi:hypothetical protein